MTPKLFRVDVTKCEAEIEIKTILRFRQVLFYVTNRS